MAGRYLPFGLYLPALFKHDPSLEIQLECVLDLTAALSTRRNSKITIKSGGSNSIVCRTARVSSTLNRPIVEEYRQAVTAIVNVIERIEHLNTELEPGALTKERTLQPPWREVLID